LRSGRGVWVQVVDGEIAVDGVAMKRGDGLAVEDTERIDIRAATDAEFLLFDLA
jgi:redox-sensitive bicupin YhaK (pirin superfamily)